MRKAVEMKLDNDQLTVRDVRDALIGLEGWGRQQVYLFNFRSGESLRNQWLDAAWVAGHIKDCGLKHVFNKTTRITPESRYSLFTIKYDRQQGRIRFVWVQNRTSLQRLESEDLPSPDFKPNSDSTAVERIVHHAYRERIERDVSSFDWDIRRGTAMIMIRKLRRTKYNEERNKLLTTFGPDTDNW